MKKIGKTLGMLLCIFSLCLEMTAQAAPLPEQTTAQEPAPALPEGFSIYEDGDVVGFIGDSITHARYCDISYIEALNQYYLCTLPDRRVEFRNLGVAGYKTCDILDIYDIDPGFQGITKAVIMLGTNEAILRYSPEKYISDMDKLITGLKEDGLTGKDILLLTPPFCDEKAASGSLFKIEKTLLQYIAELETKTQEWDVQYLDIHTPMAELTAKIQKENCENTLTTDGIHPNENGQLLIAYYLLQAQGAEKMVPVIQENAASQKENTTLRRTQKGTYGTIIQETLPWTVTAESLNFLNFYEPAKALYQEVLQIEGFSENTTYQVFMDEAELGAFTGRELADGINLAALMTHPLQRQLQQIAECNRQWHKAAVKYRDIWIDVMMQRVTYTKEQAQAKYNSWRTKDEALREEMYTLAHDTLGNPHSLVIVEKGYPAAQLESDYLAEKEQARKEAEEQAKREKEAAEQAAKEAEEQAKAQAEAAIQAAREAEEQAEAQAAMMKLLKNLFIMYLHIFP